MFDSIIEESVAETDAIFGLQHRDSYVSLDRKGAHFRHFSAEPSLVFQAWVNREPWGEKFRFTIFLRESQSQFLCCIGGLTASLKEFANMMNLLVGLNIRDENNLRTILDTLKRFKERLPKGDIVTCTF